MKGLGRTPSLGDRRGFMPPQLKTNKPCVGKPHQTFPNQFFHQIIDIDSSRAQKRKWETLQKVSDANSTQCSQAVTHPSTD
jgi:hypothetical protein